MKKTIVFVPGLMCNERLFSSQIANFSSKYHIFVADISRQVSIAGSATDILKKAPQNFILIGLSMGGIVAMEMARVAQRRISSLILLDTNPFAEKNFVKKERLSIIEKATDETLGCIFKENYIPKYFYSSVNKVKLEKICLEMVLSFDADTFVRQSKALMSRRDQIKSLKSLRCKTLIVCGKNDLLCPLSYHEEMHNIIPKSELVIIEDTGHLPTLESPLKTNDILTKFLD